jgi:uncharacterized DUF497 family protein
VLSPVVAAIWNAVKLFPVTSAHKAVLRGGFLLGARPGLDYFSLPSFIFVYTINDMVEIEFDPDKDALNMLEHDGLSLALAAELDWADAVCEVDDRFHYDEIRLNAIVPLGSRLYHVTFTERGERLRIISLRYATNKERLSYVQRYR